MLRRLAGALAALSLVLLIAAPAMAGGWAEIKVDAQTDPAPPVEGEPIVVGFTVLQHGQTPAGWEQPTVHVTDTTSGERLDVAATPSGPDGHFVATVTVPASGFWTWSVSLRDLIVESPVATPLTVYAADGTAPALDPETVVMAIAQARQDAVDATTAALSAETSRMDDQIERQRASSAAQAAQVLALTGERDALTARMDAVESAASGSAGMPMLAVVTVAVLAGATAGFLMAWLAGRAAPRQVPVSGATAPSPRGSTPG